jgi:hypothetical protein
MVKCGVFFAVRAEFVGTVSEQTAIISLNRINQLIIVTVNCGVFFAVRTES